MNRSRRMILSFAGLAALAAAILLSFAVFGGDGAAPAPDAVQGAALALAGSTVPISEVALPEVVMSADFAVGYHSVAELKGAAEVVVRGEVVDVSYVDFNTSAYTKVKFKVSKCFKGDLSVGDVITVMEVGGIISMASIKGDKFGEPSKEDADTKVKVLLDGAPLAHVGEKCLYFLGTGEIGVLSGTYYVPMGSYQGKFKIENGVAKRFAPATDSGKNESLAMDEAAVDATVTEAAAR
jgi:hypothetical protein